MEGILDSVKGMFITPEGGMKWKSLIAIAVGAVAGIFVLPEIGMAFGGPVVAGLLGGLGGLAITEGAERLTGGPSAPQAPDAGAVAKRNVPGPDRQTSAHPEIHPPGRTPAGAQPAPVRGASGLNS